MTKDTVSVSPRLNPKPLVLARLTRNEVQARNLLAQRAQACAVTLGGQAWELSLEPWAVGAPLSPPSTGDWLAQLQWAGAAFDVRLPASACQSWMAAAFPGLDLPGLPEPFAAAALESALTSLMTSPRVLQRGPARLEALRKQAAAGGRALAHHFGLSLRQGDAVVHGALSTDALGLMLMAGLVSGLPEAANGIDDDTLPMRLRVEIGTTVLSADELAALMPGDTVLMQHSWVNQNGELWLGWDRIGFKASMDDLNPTQLTVTQAMDSRGLLMPTPADTPNTSQQPVSLDSVPVRLSFDLGERSLSLGELKALQVGQSFDLVQPLSGAVQLRVNGALIGSGDLVEIDGQIGVTITALGTKGTDAR